MAGIFTQETMNNLAGPQLLEPLSFLRPPRKNCQRKVSDQTNPQRHPQHLCARESDSMRFTNISGATLLL
jgi:hypothetical protein